MSGYGLQSLKTLLTQNSYPGRGIVLGVTADGMKTVAAYFIMGRSENSRNRVFVETEDGIRTEAHDPAKVKDPSLILYHPVRQVGDVLLVTNGDQTDTIRDAWLAGGTLVSALATRTFEPDAPNYTPRITGVLYPDGGYTLAIIKCGDGAGGASLGQLFHYPPQPGVGHFLHTYQSDGNPLPSFHGEPHTVAMEGGIDDFATLLWDSLHPENKISLYVRFADLQTGAAKHRILNKYGQGGRV